MGRKQAGLGGFCIARRYAWRACVVLVSGRRGEEQPRTPEPEGQCPLLSPLCYGLCAPVTCHEAHQAVFACCLPRGTWRQTVILGGLSESLGWILIDRCGKHFGTILNYLRDDTNILPQNRQEIKELMAEAKYYLIQGLVNMCQSALQVWRRRQGQGGLRRSGLAPSFRDVGCSSWKATWHIRDESKPG